MRRPLGAAAAFLLLFAASAATAKELSWRAFDVAARLDASGALHVVETQTIDFDGDWNGGERTFRVLPGQSLVFESITRVDPDGTRHPMTSGELSAIDEYKFVSPYVLRWRSRLASDPPFDHAERVYEIAYTLSGILQKEGDRFVLDHDFAFPDREYSIRKFSLTLALDPAWKPVGPVKERWESGALPPGRGYVVRVELAYAGSGAPSINWVPPFQRAASPSLRRVLLGAFAAAVAVLFLSLRRRGDAVGLFARLTPPDRIDEGWLDQNLLSLRAEEAGALWDEMVGPPEVAAVLARLEAEKKISSRADGKKLSLHLLVPLERFRDYEHELLKGLFFGGREETDTDAIKAHYKSSGFDPASKIKPELEARLSEHASSPSPSKEPTAILAVAGAASLLAAIFLGDQDPGSVFGLALVLGVLYGAAMGTAWVFRRRITHSPATWLLVVWMPLLLLYFAWLGVHEGNRELVLFVVGAFLVKLALVRSVFNFGTTREGARRVARRKALASARQFLAHELRQPVPRLKDSWSPYVVAFGLTSEADRWFKVHGAAAAAGGAAWSGAGSSSGASSSSSSSSGGGSGGWTGGGGAFGGAGASGSWAVAAGALAAGVASPSSSSGGAGGGGGGGGGGSSGGGGGGGW